MRKEKDYSAMREADRTTVQHKSSRGALRDYTMRHKVIMEWNLNEDAKMDKIFKLKVDDLEILLDAEEVLRLLRWV